MVTILTSMDGVIPFSSSLILALRIKLSLSWRWEGNLRVLEFSTNALETPWKQEEKKKLEAWSNGREKIRGFLSIACWLPGVSTSRHKWKFWSPWKNQTSQCHEGVRSSHPIKEKRGEWENDPNGGNGGEGKSTWTRSAISAPMLSYLWAIDMTKRTLLMASFSLAKLHSISLDCNSALDILNDAATCSSVGSLPILSFSLHHPNYHH